MEIKENLYVKTRKEWRTWLSKNYKKKKEIWLIYYKKHTNKPRIQYDEAVEEAMCFGWIDSTAKKIDEESFAQKFTPRSKHIYSQLNKERLKILLKDNKVMPEIANTLNYILKEKYIFPKDILKAIKKNKAAWTNYQNFSEAYKRIRIAYVDDARDVKEIFEKRLKNFIKQTEKNKMIGVKGIEKYF
jgi:uncharacterized protein YdeI (YjbR/CyaY-like superfamily)